MQFISAYLIRQVADKSGGSTAEDIAKAMGEARRKPIPDPLEYARSRFVKIGNFDVEIAGDSRTGETAIAKDYPEGTTIGGDIVNGIARFNSDETAVCFCMYKGDPAYDAPSYPPTAVGFWTVEAGGSLAFNITSGEFNHALWLEEAQGQYGFVHKVLFMWNIPLFQTRAEAQTYVGLSSTFWETGSDTDYQNMYDYLTEHMTNAD